MEFQRSAETSVPIVLERVGAIMCHQDCRTRKARARATMSLDFSGDHHAGRNRYREFSRINARARRFSQKEVFEQDRTRRNRLPP